MRQLRGRLAIFIKTKRGDQPLRDFAKRYGLSKDTVSRIESEEQNVTIDTLQHMCKVFHCDISDLFPPD
ncbi:hypothetical protein R50073_50960 (plasmid) [Maricurvus nonylphenolicus]|uniref:helix-turn-helix domain-containing protein n=1 Tax=Maricurvus nonylphenolicus TaxID=1008307 RepID=UPI0036F38D7B